MKSLVIAIVASMLFCNSGFSQYRNAVEPELVQSLATSDVPQYITIVLKSQPEPVKVKARVAGIKERCVVRKTVVEVLKEFAVESQAGVMSVLRAAESAGEASDIITHWMANSINCRATGCLIEKLSLHPDVLAIGLSKEVQVVQGYMAPRYGVSALPVSSSATPHVIQVGADKVWGLGYTGRNVVVAVLDSGTNTAHYDLADHLWEGYADTDGDGEKDDLVNGWNFIAGNSDITDDYGHGTHCAGIVCGDGTVGNVTGVAPDASLMTVKVVNRTGGGTPSQMISGVEFAVENGADILSMSLGFKSSQISSSDIVALRKTFENVLAAGVIVCAAAGNDGESYVALENVDFPASCPPPYLHPDQQVNAGGLSSVVCVGSVDSYDNYSRTSSRGPVTWQGTEWDDYPYDEMSPGLIRPDICAPGELVYSLKHDMPDKYKYMSGTSQATPCVAGVMALLLEKNPGLTPAEICEAIENTAFKISQSKNNYTGSGRIDALAAVNSISAGESRPFIKMESYSPASMAPGGSGTIHVTLVNWGKGASSGEATAVLSVDDPYVTIEDGQAGLGVLAPGEENECVFTISTSSDMPDGHMAYMSVTVTDGDLVWVDRFCVKFSAAAKVFFSSMSPVTVKPGKGLALNVEMVNVGNVATTGETKVSLRSNSPYVDIICGEAVLGSMGVGEKDTACFVVDIDKNIPGECKVGFDVFAVPDNYADIRSMVFEFESGLGNDGYVIDAFNGWTTFDASNDGRNHPWWHSSLSAVHRVESPGEARSGKGMLMSETYCLSSMMEYQVPIDNYLVSPKIKATEGSKFCFWARVHSPSWYGEHFGVAISEKGNLSADDFETICDWTITEADGSGWRQYSVDLAAYAGKEIYVAVRHYFTAEQWEAVDYGWGTYVLHVDDATFTDVVDVSDAFVYDNYSYFTLDVKGNPLPAPANLKAEVIGEKAVALSWDAVVNAQGYNVYRDGKVIAYTVDTEYKDTGLASDREYAYCVAAVYEGKEYELSNEVVARTGRAEYSVAVKSVNPASLSVGENVLEITVVNNGKKEQKSRSRLTLTCANPYVSIETVSVNLNALAVDEEGVRTFVVVVDETMPGNSVVEFNMNVTELYEDKNVWDCPFYMTLGGSTAIDEGVRESDAPVVVYDLSGRRIAVPKRGIYIVNGKKVIVK